MRLIPKPQDGEFAPYTRMYIDLLPDDCRVLEHMQVNLQQIVDLVVGQPDTFLSEPHAPGEWTIKQILVHVVDDERIYAYRVLRVARGDQTNLPGFDQDAFAISSDANNRSLDSILREYRAVRESTIAMFDSFDDVILLRSGISDGKVMSVRAAAYHIAGHELHHLYSIKSNYFQG
ncbi:MAG: DinB family protein [Anaerolineaceae bacterium]|nr:DinB family protein [Anaerolineaceae bacterium]